MGVEASSLPTAISVIDFLQRYQYRETNPNIINDELATFPFPKILKNVLRHVYNGIPNLNTSNSSILPFIKACTDYTGASARLKSILKALSDKDISTCKGILSDVPLHFKEAKFYSDLFSGCMFGFSRELISSIIGLDDRSSDNLIKWMKPKFTTKMPSGVYCPVFVEPRYVGPIFKAIVDDGKLVIYNEQQSDCTKCFPALQSLVEICPEDRVSNIDFILPVGQRVDSIISNEFIRFKYCSTEGIVNPDDIIILDFYWNNDKKPLSVRRERLLKLVKRLQKRNANVHAVSHKLIKEPEDLEPYVTKLMDRGYGAVIKQTGSQYNAEHPKKWYKLITPQTIETVKIIDYSYKVDPFQVEFITGLTKTKKRIIITETMYDESTLTNLVPNIMGREARIHWKSIGDKAIPVLVDLK